MKRLRRNLRLISAVFVLAFALLAAGILLQQLRSRQILSKLGGENKISLSSRYASAGRILDRHGAVLAESVAGERHYSSDPLLASSLLALLGDYTQNIANTVEMNYEDVLTGQGLGFVEQLERDILGDPFHGDDLYLSLDSRLQKVAAAAIAPYQGAAVLMNWRTGELLAVANNPSVAPEAVVAWQSIPEGVLFNRAFLGSFSPGSTFKLLVDYAWLASPEYQADLLVNCKGEEPLLGPGTGSVREHRSDAGHGTLGRQDALAQSCNHFFGALGIRVGAPALAQAATELGFNQALQVGNIQAVPGTLLMSPDIDASVLSWLSIGQPLEGQELSVSPLQLALIASTFANDGVMMRPLLALEAGSSGSPHRQLEGSSVLHTLRDPAAARQVREDMIYSVANGLARGAAQSQVTVGGKTGTAEQSDAQGDLYNNALFCGFIAEPESPYALGLILEKAGVDASQIAGQIFAGILAS